MSCRGRFPRLVERAFAGALSPRASRELRRHLAGCASCRVRYERLAAVDRQLGAGAPLARFAADAIEREVLATVEAPRRRFGLWAGVGAAVAAAAVVLLVVVWPRDEALRARGGVGAGRTPGVRLFCVDPGAVLDGGAARVVADAAVIASARPTPAIRCRITQELQLAYTTPPRDGLTMVAFARHRDTILRYAPPSGEAVAVDLAPDRVDEPLAWSTRLGVNHVPGSYEVIVRIFDVPVAVDDAIGGAARPLVELRGTLEVTP